VRSKVNDDYYGGYESFDYSTFPRYNFLPLRKPPLRTSTAVAFSSLPGFRIRVLIQRFYHNRRCLPLQLLGLHFFQLTHVVMPILRNVPYEEANGEEYSVFHCFAASVSGPIIERVLYHRFHCFHDPNGSQASGSGKGECNLYRGLCVR
jgi:hypothetical protein